MRYLASSKRLINVVGFSCVPEYTAQGGMYSVGSTPVPNAIPFWFVHLQAREVKRRKKKRKMKKEWIKVLWLVYPRLVQSETGQTLSSRRPVGATTIASCRIAEPSLFGIPLGCDGMRTGARYQLMPANHARLTCTLHSSLLASV